jgi:cyclic pyranopterin phosphate synthase
MSALSHLDDEGRARMIDVGGKAVTRRVATASGRLDTTAEVVALVASDGLKKADALATARIAGIAAAKRTSELIPLAHLLPLDSVTVEFEPAESSIGIRATVAVTAKTGVEMEALTAVAVAGLTLHDMIKAVDPAAVLGDIRLLEKSGGKHGHWTPSADPPAARGTAVVIVSSTGAAAGTREDRTGPVIVEWLTTQGYTVDSPVVVADADIEVALGGAVAGSPALVITTGGTGIHPQDRTPEATRTVLDRELPGVAEAIRAAGLAVTPTAALSRALAGMAGSTIVVNLPGSPGGVRDGLAVLGTLLPHLHDQIGGGGHE